MNNASKMAAINEELIYDAVKDLTKDKLEQTVRKNAAAKNFELTDEHLSVINLLIEHYQQSCETRACLAAHDHIRFLEDAYASKGGGKYLYKLFDAMPDTRGVLMPIHELAGLPALRLETDESFGTAF
ncbi:MAG: TusE/DsrC/DsvC family sulfur relay protein [Thiohalomonadaceae bacterium]|nr:TusE/DsrC/DsvC family sulfur relay protein [Porticoccaceae bacterium]